MSEYFIEKENNLMIQNGLEFFEFLYPTAKKIVRPHIHSAVELLFITRGSFRMFCEEHEYTVSEGETILFPSNTIHRIYALEDNGSYFVLKLPHSFLLRIATEEQAAAYLLNLSLYDPSLKLHWSQEECKSIRITEFIDRLIAETSSPSYASDIAVKIYAAEILLAILRDIEKSRLHLPQEQPSNLLLRRIYDTIVYVNKHYAEDLTMEECSRMCFMSYSYFSKKFKQITGKTFKNYLLATRINHAQKLLMTTEKPITQISSECGFNNVSYFSALYKRMKGMSPSIVREQAGSAFKKEI